jgi:hypothetical protein
VKTFGYSLLLSLLLSPCPLSAAPMLSISFDEVLVFRVHPGHGEPYIVKTIYKSTENNGSFNHSYMHYDKDMSFDVMTYGNALPSRVIVTGVNLRAAYMFDGSGSVKMELKNDKGTVEKTGKFTPNVTVENALVARTLDLTSTGKHEFDLLQCGELPELIAYHMYFKVMGEETVSVEAGTFNCKKVLFSLAGWKGMFYKAYYYISNDEHRYLVKMKNMPTGGSTELIQIQDARSNAQ